MEKGNGCRRCLFLCVHFLAPVNTILQLHRNDPYLDPEHLYCLRESCCCSEKK